jgi:hypothetical protein
MLARDHDSDEHAGIPVIARFSAIAC